MIKSIAEKLLGRLLIDEDGFSKNEIENEEYKLGLKLPKILKDFYLHVGKLDIFMSSYQYFLKPEDLYIEDEKLVFLEENQVVCFWGINLEEENPLVFQMQNMDQAIWYSEEVSLSEFLKIMMYYQCAEGGYEFSGKIYNMNENELTEFITSITSKNWHKVVDHNDLIIYENERKLICYFIDEEGLSKDYPLFVSTQVEEDLIEMKKEFGFK